MPSESAAQDSLLGPAKPTQDSTTLMAFSALPQKENVSVAHEIPRTIN